MRDDDTPTRATKGNTNAKAMEENLLTSDDLENPKLEKDLAKTCFEMYIVIFTWLTLEFAYFNSKSYTQLLAVLQCSVKVLDCQSNTLRFLMCHLGHFLGQQRTR